MHIPENNEKVDSSYFYEGIKDRVTELNEVKKLIDGIPIERMADLPKYVIEAYTALSNHLLTMTSTFSPNSNLMRLETQEAKKELFQKICAQYKNYSKEELLKELFNKSAFQLMITETLKSFAEELKIVRPYFQESILNHYQTTSNRQTKREEKYEQDKRYMRTCLARATNFGRSAVDPQHYILFKKYVIEHFKPSSMKGELIEVPEGKDSGWSEGTMRKFFEEETGEKPTSLV